MLKRVRLMKWGMEKKDEKEEEVTMKKEAS